MKKGYIAHGAYRSGISTPRLLLRPARRQDFSAWQVLRHQSRDFLTPWEPLWITNALSHRNFRRRTSFYRRAWRQGQAYSFLIFAKDGGELLGGITMENVQRGPIQTATLGYWLGRQHVRQGIMREALVAIIDFAFSLGLWRLQAACLPRNVASRNLLEKIGFREEGLARGLLEISGRRQNHVLYALLLEDRRPTLKDLSAAAAAAAPVAKGEDDHASSSVLRSNCR